MAMEIGTKYKQCSDQEYIDSIRKHRGNLTAVARELGVYRTTVAKKVNGNPNIKQVVDEERDSFIDLGEDRLLGLVDQSSFPAIKYMLSTIGRARGWSEETTINLNNQDNVEYDLSELSQEEMAILERITSKLKPKSS